MHFEHDTYDIDVYSLCESVYYSCNNDEYDYVLECVNDWIMNGYNDNILLEDIVLNEAINGVTLEKLIEKKFHQLFPGEDYNNYTRGKFRKLPLTHPIHQFFHYVIDLEYRNIKQNKKNFLKFHPDYSENLYNGGYVGNLNKLSPEEKEQAIEDIHRSQHSNPHFTIKSRNLYRKLVGKPPFVPGSTEQPKPKQDVETKTQQEPPKPPSPTPLEDKKGQPAQTPPTPPPRPQQQEPPKSNTPVVASNNTSNNQSRLSRATNYMKNNKGKIGLGVGLGAVAIGGSIYAYKRFKNKPRSVIAKRIQALRGVYHKFMINAQRNPNKANVFKRIAAKILSVIDKLLHYLQNKADGR